MHKNGDLWSFNTRDLMRASSCQHCTTLSVARTLGDAQAVERIRLSGDEKQSTLAMKAGITFEANLVRELETLSDGQVVGMANGNLEKTIELMHRGVAIIVQGGLKHAKGVTLFSGQPDFLVRNDWRLAFTSQGLTAEAVPEKKFTGYTVWDAKYSSHVKPEYALQVAIYIDALDAIGYKAENSRHGLILGNRTLIDFFEGEIVPATRLARQQLEETITSLTSRGDSGSSELLQDFVWHCDSAKECTICEYPKLCDKSRTETRDLLLVAGLGKNLKEKLRTAGIKSLNQLAASSEKPNGVSQATFEKVSAQARVQLVNLETGNDHFEILDDPAFQFLPKPSAGDVFFDMEGFPYFPNGGLEYLFGNWTDDLGFKDFWANNRAEEKQAFVAFMDWLMQRMDDDPMAHVFHYASYERTALKKLSMRHSVKYREVARLEAEGRLVDLYPVVVKSLRVSEPRYSIKNLEKFYGFTRESAVLKADDSMDEYAKWREQVNKLGNTSLTGSERAKEIAEEQSLFDALKLYNTEDVKSTKALYDWLLTFEGATSRFGENRINQEQEQREPTEAEKKLRELEKRTEEILALSAGIERGQSVELDDQLTAWETLAHSILFYRREDVMYWTNLFVRLQQEPEDFEQDREALLIFEVSELSRDDRTAEETQRQFTRIEYEATFDPESLYEPIPKDDLVVRFLLPGQIASRNFGKVISVDGSRITFYRDVSEERDLAFTPDAIFKHQKFLSGSKQEKLVELVDSIVRDWCSPNKPAPTASSALDLLLRREPALIDGEPATADSQNYLPALIDTVSRMQGTVLAVQGPPGSGKTYLASRVIQDLLGKGKRVAVTANSHSAIHNVLEACMEAGVDGQLIYKTRQDRDKGPYPWRSFSSNQTAGNNLAKATGAWVFGGTSFSLCNKDIAPNRVDYLIVDEAAQFSLVDALAVASFADNIILLGDPQQLPQVVQALHPGGVESSALGHFMGDDQILPKKLGYFVEVTRRLHPAINKTVSWLAYENKLSSHEDTNKYVIKGAPPGVHTVELDHTGNSTYSPEEVDKVLGLVKDHIDEVGAEEILVVAPYNAQVNAIRIALDEVGFNEVRVGTVDKFQGREGLVVIFSLAASSAQDAPRGLGFLLNRNRMNVAISRAKSVCYVVRSKHLLRASFSSVDDVRCVSRLSGIHNFSR